MTTTPGTEWTTRRLLQWMTERFESAEHDAPRMVAEMLLGHVIGCERLHLYMDADRPASDEERSALRDLVKRALDDEPVQYLVGWTNFYGLRMACGPATLIPQPCTEDLVEHVLGERPGEPLRILDVGTGTGCIAIAIADRRPETAIVATDLVPAALELARANIDAHDVADQIECRAGSLYEPVAGDDPFDVIATNPPYIPDDEWTPELVDVCVRRHVPESATRGGTDGLALVEPLIRGARERLVPGGLLIVEVAASRAEEACAIARDTGLSAEIHRDSEGFDRFIVARS